MQPRSDGTAPWPETRTSRSGSCAIYLRQSQFGLGGCSSGCAFLKAVAPSRVTASKDEARGEALRAPVRRSRMSLRISAFSVTASVLQLPESCHFPRSCQSDFSFEPYFQTDPIGEAVALPVAGAMGGRGDSCAWQWWQRTPQRGLEYYRNRKFQGPVDAVQKKPLP